MIKLLLALVLISTCSSAKITLKDIESKPQSRAKDFMIWQYLKQNITPSQADAAFKQVDNSKNRRLTYAYAKKTKNKKITYESSCRNKAKLLKIKDQKCLELAFTPYKATRLTNEQRSILSTRLASKSKQQVLSILNEKHSVEAYRKYDVSTILSLFGSTGKKYRKKHLNILLDKKFLDPLTSSWRIKHLINTIVHNDELDKLQLSLLDIDGSNLNERSNFLLALNDLRNSDTKASVTYFRFARSKAKYQLDIDKNNFWLYKLTKENKYLNSLLMSMDINMYTLYQREKLNIEFENYFISLKTDDSKPTNTLSDPFYWEEVRKKIRATKKGDLNLLANQYKQKEMLPVQTMIVQKASGYNKHGYIMPYDEYLDGLNPDTKALVYALMRQESNMIPSALSHSYALGLMQIMPFVTDDISKRIKNPI